MNEIDANLTSPAFFAHGDPHALFAKLRREDPIHWTETNFSKNFWSLTKYKDARFVLMNDDRLFSVQQYGASLPQTPEMESSYFIELMRSGAQLAIMDGNPHTELRKVFNSTFSFNGIGTIEGLVRDVVEDILSDILPREKCDFTVDLAGRVPVAVICAMMDIDRQHWDNLYLWNNMHAAPDDPEFSIGTALETSTVSTKNIIGLCSKIALERRQKPGQDLISMLATAKVEGKYLSDTQLGFNSLMFFAAGHETTRASLSAGLLELLKDPAQMQLLRSVKNDPVALRVAADEFVRWASPLTHTLRTATEDTRIGDQPIKKGDWVVLWYGSANRDEDVFPNADRFDITRRPNNHIGFAVGKHFCLGTHLAHLEMRILLEYILTYMDEIELAGPVGMAASTLFWGIKHLPIRFKAKAFEKSPRRTAMHAGG